MPLSRQQVLWLEVGQQRGLSVETDVRVELNAKTVSVPVLLRGYGARRGMVLVSDYSLIADHTEELVSSGFGYSCVTLDDHCDDDSFDEMLEDWGATDASD